MVETDPEAALSGFAEVVSMEPEKAEWQNMILLFLKLDPNNTFFTENREKGNLTNRLYTQGVQSLEADCEAVLSAWEIR